MRKFFVKNENISKNIAKIVGEDVKHMKNVLRLLQNDIIIVCDEDGKNYQAKITSIQKDEVKTLILREFDNTTEPDINITVFQCLPKSDKMELIIQKCTELGVTEFTPVSSENVVVSLDSSKAEKKITRWQKIAEEAAKQSKRSKIPKINNIIDLDEIKDCISDKDLVLLAYEKEEGNGIKEVLSKLDHSAIKDVAIIIGAEGGFTENEVENLKQISNLKSISLGPRILRTETAGIVLAGIVLYEFNEMG